MHKTLETVAADFTVANIMRGINIFSALTEEKAGSWILHSPERKACYGPSHCKDGLMSKLKFTKLDVAHNLGDSDIYFQFDNHFDTFKKAICDTFQLLTKETPCNFYKLDETYTILRLKSSHFFCSRLPLVDLFVVISRMVSLKGSAFESRERLIDFIATHEWRNTSYTSPVINAIIRKFEEFLNLVENDEEVRDEVQDKLVSVNAFLRESNGLRNVHWYMARPETPLQQRKDDGSYNGIILVIPPSLIEFVKP